MRRLCFDCDGLQHDQGYLEHRFGSALSDDSFAAYAAANLGYVSAAVRSDDYIRLWVRPSHASEQALTEAVFWLAQCDAGRIVLECMNDKKWSTTIAPLGHVIDLLCAYSDQKLLGDGYRRTETEHVPQPLQELLDLWKAHAGVYHPEAYRSLARSLLNDRLFVVAKSADHLYYRDFGTGMANNTFAAEVRKGVPVEKLSDTTYALHTAISYHEAFQNSDRPTLEQVSAHVKSHSFPEAQIEYIRLLLPCRSAHGESLLVGSSVVHSMIH